MDKKIVKLSLTEIQAVVGGVTVAAKPSISFTAPAMATRLPAPSSPYETLLARR